MTPSPSPQHQRVAKRLQRQLEDYFETRGLGEVFNAPLDVILGPHDVVEPDSIVVTDPATVSRCAIERPRAIAVEVLSPSTQRADRVGKRQRYALTGVRHYWMVNIEEQHLVCLRLAGAHYEMSAEGRGDERVAHPDWPDLAIDPAPLWR